jgi:hypothetical protein
MAQIIVDEHIDPEEVIEPIRRWITVQRLRELRPGEVIKDERVPMLLRQLRQPTFVTLDRGFWHPRLRDPRFGVVFLSLDSEEQRQIPGLLRSLLRLPEFRTRAARMGKVARVSPAQIDYWEIGSEAVQRLSWPERRRTTPS